MVYVSTFLGLAALWQAPQEPIVTDRPDFTESSLVVAPGSTQIESGVTYLRAGRDEKAWNAPEILLRHGVAKKTEVRIGLPNFNRINSRGERLEGLDDVYLGAKVQLGPTRGVDWALIPALSIPVGKRGIRSESTCPEVKGVYSFDIDGELTLSGMLFVAWNEVDGRKRTDYQKTISLGIPVREQVGMFVEHVFDFSPHNRPQHTLHSGFTYQPRPDRQFDIHFGFGLTPDAADWFLGGGFSIRF